MSGSPICEGSWLTPFEGHAVTAGLDIHRLPRRRMMLLQKVEWRQRFRHGTSVSLLAAKVLVRLSRVPVTLVFLFSPWHFRPYRHGRVAASDLSYPSPPDGSGAAARSFRRVVRSTFETSHRGVRYVSGNTRSETAKLSPGGNPRGQKPIGQSPSVEAQAGIAIKREPLPAKEEAQWVHAIGLCSGDCIEGGNRNETRVTDAPPKDNFPKGTSPDQPKV